MMNVRVRRASALVTVSAAVLMVCTVPAVASAASAPSLTPGGPYTVWAYGGVKNVSFSGSSGHPGWVYQGSAMIGYSVILNQTNLTSTSFELYASRTMGASLYVEYCLVRCGHTNETASISYHAYESDNEWANFTTAGTVYESGSPVNAIALNNTHSTVTSSLVDRAAGPLRSDYLVINASSSANVAFAPPLGLLPTNLTPGVSWNSTSAFTAAGSFALSYYYAHVGPLGDYNVSAPISGSVNTSGTVAVVGSAGPRSVQLDGNAYQNLSLAVLGPFSVREGFILVPSEVDLFGGSSEQPLSDASGASAAAMTSIYARPLVGGHLGVVGSEWTYASSALNPTIANIVPTSGAGVNELASGSDQVASTTVQGVPMSVSSAHGVGQCLETGASCPAATGPTHLLGGLLVVGGVAVAAVLVALVVVVDRRRLPPPRRSNAGLYPPVVTVPGRAPPAASDGQNPPPPPPPEEDPLSHLW